MRRLLAAAVVLAVAAGCHEHPNPKPTPSTSASPTPNASPSASPSASASPSSSPTASPTTPPPAGFPTAETTGAPVETGLPRGACSLGAGEYVGLLFDCGTLEVRSGTIIRQSVIRGEVKGDPAGQGFVVEDSTIDGGPGCRGAAAIGNSNYTATRVHIKGFNDGARAEGPNVVVRDSLIEICFSEGGHADGLQVCPASAGCGGSADVSGLVFHHNTVTHPRADSTGAVFVMGGSTDGQITDNLMSGFSITLRVHGDGYTVTGNRLVADSWLYEPVDCGGAGDLKWSDNRLVTIGESYRIASVGAEVPCG